MAVKAGGGKSHRPSFWRRWKGLHWATPVRWAPHGYTGALGLALGLLLTLGSLLGNFRLLESQFALPAYVLASSTNAAAGLVLAGKQRESVRMGFRVAAVAQLCLLWCAWRLRPVSVLPSFSLYGLERALDGFAAGGLLAGNLAMVYAALTIVLREQGAGAAAGICGGSIGLLFLSAYPVHLAVGGDSWIDCVVKQYPMQLQGFSGYVYVPATFVFAAMLFGATLLDRNIISGVQFGAGFGGSVGVILFTTVLVQEVHIPVISTQRLILPCPEPPASSFLGWLGSVLDTSTLAQGVLVAMGVLPMPGAKAEL